jgi:hypothetical protein
VHLEFGRNGRAVKLNRPFVDAQVGRDLLVHLAGDDVAQDLQLATREGIESGPQRVPVSILGALPGITGNGPVHRREESPPSARRLVRKSSAPWRIACTVVGMSPAPERKTTGTMFAPRASACWRSSPSIPGIRRSVMTHPAPSPSFARKSAADAYVWTA